MSGMFLRHSVYTELLRQFHVFPVCQHITTNRLASHIGHDLLATGLN